MTPENLRTTFNLRSYMRACGIKTYQQLADETGFSKSLIQQVGGGYLKPSKPLLKLLEKIAKERGVTPT
jgi:predicted transcriptional regulator